MAKRIQDGKLLYHVTAVKNLESILRKGLLSRKDVEDKGLGNNLVDIADQDIIKKRKELGIFQFVPFHFFEPTAFTGIVFKSHPNESFCSITILRDFAKQQNFQICTAHPLSQNPVAEVMSYNEGFKAINWEKAEERNYNDLISKNACMAECLATSPVTPDDFFMIYVANDGTQDYVENLATDILGNYKFDICVNTTFSKA
ncbi:DUF4433 domain-containing protein [bacterium]|nr:DUF4433 domain-containing protein [bacterium]